HPTMMRRFAAEFIPKAIAVGFLIVLCSLATPAGAVEPSTDHDVVIVGAGSAGLYAAYTLDNLGFSVLILEATNRHGGRVYSDTLGDVGIEHGAEELYGTLNNFVFNQIVSEYGSGAQIPIFLENSSQDQMLVMDADGMGGGNTCWVVTGDCYLDADIYDYWDFYYQIGDHNNDATDPLVSDFMSNTWGVSSGSRGYHLYEAGTPAGAYGTTVERLGVRSLSREWNGFSLTGAVYGLSPTGYLDALNTLYFDQVTPYATYNSPITVVDASGIKPVAIDDNGVYHYADSIVVTVSLGVLKAEIIDFIPDLPASKLDAIDTIGMGKGMKISLRFSSQIWVSKFMSLLADGPAGNCWTPNKYQPSATDHVLTCFLMGINAEVMAALPDDTARINQVLTDLDAAFGGAASANFVEGIVQDWTAEPYVLGSYSYPAPGTRPLTGLTQREVLAQPVGSTLYFAGEATHNTAASTVPGALQSGLRAASEINTTWGGPPAAGTPAANFSASVTVGGTPLDVTFTDLSSQIPTGWSWDFGDSGTSSVQNPTHQYTTPGTYTVSLTATNPNGSHTRVLPMLISVPEPSFYTGLVSGVLGLLLMRSRRLQRATVHK
ncbi:MAG: FAD-dependent oxidoreductase, partial [Myxococcota bacterium]